MPYLDIVFNVRERLLCCRPVISANADMKIGGEDRPAFVQKRHWERFATATGIKLQLVQRECINLVAHLAQSAAECLVSFEAEYGEVEEVYKIVTLIVQRSRKLTSIFNA